MWKTILNMLFKHEKRLKRLEKRMSDQQSQIDADAQEVADLKAEFDTFVTGVQKQITDLQAQVAAAQNGTPLNLDALKSALDTLKSDVDTAANPTPPTP